MPVVCYLQQWHIRIFTVTRNRNHMDLCLQGSGDLCMCGSQTNQNIIQILLFIGDL